jgi:hypothetical protein
MADQKISQLTTLTGADANESDLIPIVDVSPTSTTKKMTRAEFFKNAPTIGIGTSSPAASVHIENFTVNKIRLQSSSGVGGGLISWNDNLGNRTKYLGTSSNDSDEFLIVQESDANIRLSTNGATRMIITGAGNVGIGTTSPSERLSVSGNVTITGSLSKGSGSFKIDHPVKPDTHYLVHSFIEGPQADNIYRGKVTLVGGVATVNLDEAGRMTQGTFVALNGNVQCFTTNESGWTAVRGTVEGNNLSIEAQDASCTDTVSWLVIGERHDQHMLDTGWTDENGRIITEPLKQSSSDQAI